MSTRFLVAFVATLWTMGMISLVSTTWYTVHWGERHQVVHLQSRPGYFYGEPPREYVLFGDCALVRRDLAPPPSLRPADDSTVLTCELEPRECRNAVRELVSAGLMNVDRKRLAEIKRKVRIHDLGCGVFYRVNLRSYNTPGHHAWRGLTASGCTSAAQTAPVIFGDGDPSRVIATVEAARAAAALWRRWEDRFGAAESRTTDRHCRRYQVGDWVRCHPHNGEIYCHPMLVGSG